MLSCLSGCAFWWPPACLSLRKVRTTLTCCAVVADDACGVIGRAQVCSRLREGGDLGVGEVLVYACDLERCSMSAFNEVAHRPCGVPDSLILLNGVVLVYEWVC